MKAKFETALKPSESGKRYGQAIMHAVEIRIREKGSALAARLDFLNTLCAESSGNTVCVIEDRK